MRVYRYVITGTGHKITLRSAKFVYTATTKRTAPKSREIVFVLRAFRSFSDLIDELSLANEQGKGRRCDAAKGWSRCRRPRLERREWTPMWSNCKFLLHRC